jgi:ABC-2 type transport system permease protein
MKPSRIFIIVGKEWQIILRDKIFFFLSFIVPVLLLVALGYGISLDVEAIPFVIQDEDGTSLSRDYGYRFISSPYFDFRGYVNDHRVIDRLLVEQKIRAAIVIPEHFQEKLFSGKSASVQTLIDGIFPFRAKTIKGYVIAINQALTQEFLFEHLCKTRGISPERARQLLQPVELEVRYLYNQSLDSKWALAPNLLMIILLLTPPFLTALGVAREKENGSIFNIYASQVSRMEFLLGKLVPFVAISAINSIILWFLVVWLFETPFKGNLPFFLGVTLLYIFCTSSIGLLVSVFVRTQLAAVLIVMIITMPTAMLFSGFIVPISSLSLNSRIFAHLLPAMYYSNIVSSIFLKASGPLVLWKDIGALGLYTIILLSACYALFSKRPKQ